VSKNYRNKNIFSSTVQIVRELASVARTGIKISKVVDGVKRAIVYTSQLGWEVIDRAG
jgi:hypothetical protein